MPELLMQKYRDRLATWIGKKCHFRLLYKISRDGCSAQTFHQKCDGQGPTVTVLYNTNNTIYGGYLSQSWNSNDEYISDSNAFLFRLQYNGSSNPVKVPVNSSYVDNYNGFGDRYEYDELMEQTCNRYRCAIGGYGHHNYGPTFGGNYDPPPRDIRLKSANRFAMNDFHGSSFGANHDLCSFTGTISKSGNQFALNGSLNMSDINYNGENTNSMTNNNLTVTDLEVYLVVDGPGTRLVDKPWREPPEWNTESFHSLKDYISKYHPLEDTSVKNVNILLLGQVGAGKSSFFNTINSIFRGEITSRACSGSSEHSLTTTLRKYRVREPTSGQYLNLRLCDMRGLEESVGVKTQDIALVLDGNIPEHYQFNPASHATTKSPGFKRDPTLQDKIHTLAFVIDASTISVITTAVTHQMKEIQNLSVERVNCFLHGIIKEMLLPIYDIKRMINIWNSIPQVIYLTKLDKICPDVDNDIRNIFTSSACKQAVDTVADVIGVPRSHVFPVKNYEKETRLHTSIDILALSAFRQTLVFADDYLEDQSEFAE